jgi:hypothetical protein
MYKEEVNSALARAADARVVGRGEDSIAGDDATCDSSDFSGGCVEVSSQNERLASVDEMS